MHDYPAPAHSQAATLSQNEVAILAETFRLRADQVLSAIGQRLSVMPDGLIVAGGKIAVTGPGRSALPGVWAGGDCTDEGEDLTVSAVAQGRDAAEDIHAWLMGQNHG